MRRLIGSKRITLARDISEWLQTNFYDEAVEVVEKIVMSGSPFPGLQLEGQVHYEVARTLAEYEQIDHGDSIECGPNTLDLWGPLKWYWSLAESLKIEGCAPFLKALVIGTPLFGTRLDYSWSSYTIVGHAKLDGIAAGLRELLKCFEHKYGTQHIRHEFLDALCSKVNTISTNRDDLWSSKNIQCY